MNQMFVFFVVKIAFMLKEEDVFVFKDI